MSNPANTGAQTEGTEASSATPDRETSDKAFSVQVNEVVKQLQFDEEKNTYVLPEGEYPEELAVAVMAEKRRRDTESALGKSRQKLKAIEAENAELKKKLSSTIQVNMSPEEQQELEDLKFADPDAWRIKVNELEQRAAAKLNEDLGEISANASQQAEIERRSQVMQQFSEDHDGFQFTDEVIANDIPPRITKKLEEGKISFEEFLNESYEYIHKGKVIKTETLETSPNLGSVGGDSKPSTSAVDKDTAESYNDDVY